MNDATTNEQDQPSVDRWVHLVIEGEEEINVARIVKQAATLPPKGGEFGADGKAEDDVDPAPRK
jgi:hypothetical protein